MDTPRPDQDVRDDADRAPRKESADGGNGDSGQQLERTSGDEQSEAQSEAQPEEPLEEPSE